VLSLCWCDVLNNGNINEHISITEKKTGKKTLIKINKSIKSALKLYINKEGIKTEFIFHNKSGNLISDECVGILLTSFKYTDTNDIAFDKFVYKDIEDNIVISYNTETQRWEESTENPEESSISFPS
jgi:integrase